MRYYVENAAEVEAIVAEAISACEELVEDVVGVQGARTFNNTMLPLEAVAAVLAEADGRGPFLAHVHVDEQVREAARSSEQRLRQWATELEFREDLYRAVKAYQETAEASELSGEARRFLEHTMRDFRLVGHELPGPKRARAQEIRQRLVSLEVDFARNIAEDDSHLLVSRADLAGLPDDYVEGLEPGKEEGTFKITMSYPDVIPFLEHAERRDLRQALSLIYNNRAAAENRPILAEALALRLEMANLFGLGSWADYRFQVKMAKRVDRVEALYEDLLPRLTKGGQEELAIMTDLLERDMQDRDFRSWDYRFYETLLRKTDYGVDPFLVAEYLPLHEVLEGLFAITGEVFGLDYEEVSNTGSWHEDAKLFGVFDRKTGELLAHFFMDLHPRPGKFSHAAAWPLRPGRQGELTPISAIVANLPKPTGGKPALLRHDDVVTLFHEFGHVLHMSLAKVRFTRFSGGQTEWDFVEAPSQIMEHWCWQPEVLRRFARHHATGDPIPAGIVDQLVAAKNLNTGLFHLRQISYGLLDLRYHGPEQEKDLEAILEESYAVGLIPFPEGTFFPASFGHLLGGYDAGYYGYLWAKVLGDDMFSRFEEAGFTDPEVGAEYRRKVLEPNGSRDADDLVRDFLGREPSGDSFIRYNGIGN